MVVIALLAASTVLGLSVWIMTAPWFTALASPGQVDSASAGLPPERMVELAEQVRAFVTDVDAPPLPATVDGRAAFDESAVSHLIDVRDVILAGRWATLVAAALLLLTGLYAGSTGHGVELATGLKWGGLLVLSGIGLSLLAGVVDFGSFFSAFHGLFFQPGTWTFPADSLLILVFPIGFWILAGAITGVVATTLALALVVIGRFMLAQA